MKFGRPRDVAISVALLAVVATMFWVDQATPPATPVAVLYALPLFLAGAWLVDWVAALIGAVAVSLYLLEAVVRFGTLTPYRGAGLLALVLACWWAVRTGRDHARLKALSEDLAAKASELERLRVQREAMNSIVAHELRGALSSVSGYSKLLLRNMSGGDGNENALRAIASGSDRLDRLTQDLLEEAGLELGQLILNRQSCDLVHSMAENVDFYRELTGRRIDLAAPHEAVFGNWDELRITQVIRNLLTNALKYSPPEVAIQCFVTSGDDAASVAVRNTANGITEEDLARVFLPYNRLEVHRQLHGNGLGLHVTKSLVERHGGRIDVSLEGPMVEFRFTLPR
jgi:signal transduction histidine kinase